MWAVGLPCVFWAEMSPGDEFQGVFVLGFGLGFRV